MINWDVSNDDYHKIRQIVNRADKLDLCNTDLTPMNLQMDLTACHCNGNPLELDDMLNADESDFIHDILGIVQYIDRRDGKLREGFSPRFSKVMSKVV